MVMMIGAGRVERLRLFDFFFFCILSLNGWGREILRLEWGMIFS